MASMNSTEGQSQQARLLETLQRLLSIENVGLVPAMQQATQQVSEVLKADKVDVFLASADEHELVAVGSNSSEMTRRQKALGLDHLSLSGGGLTVRTFHTGVSYLTRNAAEEPDELQAVWQELGVRTSMSVPLEVLGLARGVFLASAAAPDFFAESDLRFLEAVAHWMALIGQRAANLEQLAELIAEESLREAASTLVRILTRRQQEVAALIAQGLTNEEIALRLVLTPGTVANHVGSILERLGLRSRSQVAVWAIERGLTQPPSISR
jgi:two-component system, OmpR family, sensor kinase